MILSDRVQCHGVNEPRGISGALEGTVVGTGEGGGGKAGGGTSTGKCPAVGVSSAQRRSGRTSKRPGRESGGEGRPVG